MKVHLGNRCPCFIRTSFWGVSIIRTAFSVYYTIIAPNPKPQLSSIGLSGKDKGLKSPARKEKLERSRVSPFGGFFELLFNVCRRVLGPRA